MVDIVLDLFFDLFKPEVGEPLLEDDLRLPAVFQPSALGLALRGRRSSKVSAVSALCTASDSSELLLLQWSLSWKGDLATST